MSQFRQMRVAGYLSAAQSRTVVAVLAHGVPRHCFRGRSIEIITRVPVEQPPSFSSRCKNRVRHAVRARCVAASPAMRVVLRLRIPETRPSCAGTNRRVQFQLRYHDSIGFRRSGTAIPPGGRIVLVKLQPRLCAASGRKALTVQSCCDSLVSYEIPAEQCRAGRESKSRAVRQ
jgi:hypothetical protein